MIRARLPARMLPPLALLAGAALPLAFAPFHWYWLAPALVALLFLLWLGAAGPRQAAGYGFAFGFGAFASGTWWLYISIHLIGGAPPLLALLVMGLLMAVMGGYFALCGWLAARLVRGGGAIACLLTLPGCWLLVEWLRGWLLTGFPWLSLGYAQVDGPLRGWAPVLGVYGLSLLTALAAGALVLLLTGDWRRRGLAAGVLVLLGLSGWLLADRQWTVPVGDPLRVSLVQGDVAQERKWRPEELVATMDLYRGLTLELADVDLVIWPEAAIPALAHEVGDFLDELAEEARARGYTLLTGILIYDFLRREFSNSLLALGATPGVYDKRHLVPFGEYFPVPAFVRDFLRLLDLPYQDITPGRRDQPPLLAGGVPLAPGICYEAVLGARMRDFFPAAQLLVNVSNDGWFGDSIAPHQHLQMARARALESGRYLLRATNTGITAIVAPDGRVQSRIPQFAIGVLTDRVEPRTGQTPFLVYGNAPAVLLALFLLFAGILWRHLSPGPSR